MIYTKKPNFFYIYFYLSKIKTKLIVAIKIDNFIYLCCKKYYLHFLRNHVHKSCHPYNFQKVTSSQSCL